MSAETNDRLLALAASISDGAAIDWKQEESAARHEEERDLLESLQIVDLLSRLQRTPIDRESMRLARMISARLGGIEILEPIGHGAFGAVYRAWDPRLEREVAIKITTPRLGEGAGGGAAANAASAISLASGRASAGVSATSGAGESAWRVPGRGLAGADPVAALLAEGRRLASVRHASVVTVHAAEAIEGGAAIVLELVRGRTLAEIVRERGPFGPEEAAAIGVRIAGALAAVHAAGILHQDVKPQNVMREEGGRIVLMDFGPVAGTPLTMAPEVLDGASPSVHSDLYSLGVLLHFALTGAYPVTAQSIDELRRAHARGSVVRVRDARPDLPAALAAVIDRALASDPAGRFASAAEMETALAAAASERAVLPDVRPRDRHGARRALLGGAVAAGVLVLLALTIARFAGRPAPAATPSTTARIAPELGLEHLAQDRAAFAPFTIEARFFRGSEQREPLADGMQLALGDSVSLRVHASESLYVYVVDEADDGEAYLLFPAAGMRPTNPLPPGTDHALPGARDGRQFYWQVTSAGGREHLVVIASRERLVQVEADALLLDRPVEGRPVAYPRLTARARDVLRGLGGLVGDGGGGEEEMAQRFHELASPLLESAEEARGVWIRKIELENPAS